MRNVSDHNNTRVRYNRDVTKMKTGPLLSRFSFFGPTILVLRNREYHVDRVGTRILFSRNLL